MKMAKVDNYTRRGHMYGVDCELYGTCGGTWIKEACRASQVFQILGVFGCRKIRYFFTKYVYQE